MVTICWVASPLKEGNMYSDIFEWLHDPEKIAAVQQYGNTSIHGAFINVTSLRSAIELMSTHQLKIQDWLSPKGLHLEFGIPLSSTKKPTTKIPHSLYKIPVTDMPKFQIMSDTFEADIAEDLIYEKLELKDLDPEVFQAAYATWYWFYDERYVRRLEIGYKGKGNLKILDLE